MTRRPPFPWRETVVLSAALVVVAMAALLVGAAILDSHAAHRQPIPGTVSICPAGSR